MTAGCRPVVIINELPIDWSLRPTIYRNGSSSRVALITLAQLEGRNSKRIIDRMARPVAVFQRFTASGTTSISLRQSLSACRKAMTAWEGSPGISALSWLKSKSSIAVRRSTNVRSVVNMGSGGWIVAEIACSKLATLMRISPRWSPLNLYKGVNDFDDDNDENSEGSLI